MTVVVPVVCEVAVLLVASLAGDALAVTLETREIDTETVHVAVCPSESLAVHNALPPRVSAGPRPEALNVVEAADGVVAEMPVPPLCQVHA